MEKMDLAEVAFQLLQWAEYGDIPNFKKTIDSDSESEEEGNKETEEKPKWADDVVQTSVDLPEADDPPGFESDIALRPYQKQALHWMKGRETDPSNRDTIEKELELLAELTPNAAKVKHQNIYRQQEKDVVCECGPVLVNEKARETVKTIDGQVNPVNHPLWQRRYLASSDFSSALCFYVNEVVGVATALPPEPPKPSNGGILADAMGLVSALKCCYMLRHCAPR